MRETGEMKMREIAAELGVDEATLYRHLARHRQETAAQGAEEGRLSRVKRATSKDLGNCPTATR